MARVPQTVVARNRAEENTLTLPFWHVLPPFADVGLPVLLTGERGTGKTHLGSDIHEKTRAGRPFVTFDCQAPAPGDVDVLLFGNRGVAGVFDEAADGTLLLRNIDSLPLDTQRRLARFLGSDANRAHVIATTTRQPHDLVGGARFSDELFDRIARLVVQLPPLRTRRMQIPVLVADLLEKLGAPDLPAASLTEKAMHALVTYEWPGNIRQLQNELERMLTLVSSEPAPVIRFEDLPEDIRGVNPTGTAGDGASGDSLDHALARTERQIIERVLERNRGHVSASADELGLTRQGLYKKMKRLGIDASRFQPINSGALES